MANPTSSITRLGLAQRLAALRRDGGTLDSITAELNRYLEQATRTARVSRGAVGRAVKRHDRQRGTAAPRSRLTRLGLQPRLKALRPAGGTAKSITAALNRELVATGRSERLSCGSVSAACRSITRRSSDLL